MNARPGQRYPEVPQNTIYVCLEYRGDEIAEVLNVK